MSPIHPVAATQPNALAPAMPLTSAHHALLAGAWRGIANAPAVARPRRPAPPSLDNVVANRIAGRHPWQTPEEIVARGSGPRMARDRQRHIARAEARPWLFSGAEAALPKPRAVPWSRTPKTGTARLEVTPVSVTQDDWESRYGPPPLQTQERWSLARAMEVGKAQFRTFMRELPWTHWGRYIELLAQRNRQSAEVAAGFNQRMARWSNQTKAALDAGLAAQAGRPIRAAELWLQTDYLVPRGSVTPILPVRHGRAPADDVPVAVRRSIPLWEAACRNFPFNVAHGLGSGLAFIDASYISSDAEGRYRLAEPSVRAFVRTVRDIDPGASLEAALLPILQPPTHGNASLDAMYATQLRFDALEAQRQSNLTGVSDAIAQAIGVAVGKAQTGHNWIRYRLDLGSQWPIAGTGTSISLPFFTITLPGVRGVLSYAQGAPIASFRHHADTGTARAYLASLADPTAPWLLRQLSAPDQAQAANMVRDLNARNVRPEGLNPFATVLYDLVTSVTGEAQLALAVDAQSRSVPQVNFHSHVISSRLIDPILTYNIHRIRQNALSMATSNANKDAERVVDALADGAREVLDLLLMPTPGNLIGLTRLRAILFGGVIGYGVTQGVAGAIHGDPATLAGSSIDVLDYFFSAAIGRMRPKSDTPRPTRITLADGSEGVWIADFAGFQAADPVLAAGRAADADGLIDILGEHFVEIADHRRVTHTLAVDRDAGTLRLRPTDPRGFRAPVMRDGAGWKLALDDTANVDDATLLGRMLSNVVPPVGHSKSEQLLRVTELDRGLLETIWYGSQTPQALVEAIGMQQVQSELRQLRADDPGYALPLATTGEALILQCVADMTGQTLQRVGPATGAIATFTPWKASASPSAILQVERSATRWRSRAGAGGTWQEVAADRSAAGLLETLLAALPELGAATPRPPAPKPTLESRRLGLQRQFARYLQKNNYALTEALLTARGFVGVPAAANRFAAMARIATGRVMEPEIPETPEQSRLRHQVRGLSPRSAHAVLADAATCVQTGDAANPSLAELRDDVRLIRARLLALDDTYDGDSEALLLSAITRDAHWPAGLAVHIEQGVAGSRENHFVRSGVIVARHGDESPTTVLTLVRSPDREYRLPRSDAVPTTRTLRQALSQAVAMHGGETLATSLAEVFDPAKAIGSLSRSESIEALQAVQLLRAPASTMPAPSEPRTPLTDLTPVAGIYTVDDRHYISVDGASYRVGEDAIDVAIVGTDTTARRRNDGTWHVRRSTAAVRALIDQFDGPVGRFGLASMLQLPIDGIDVATQGGGYRYTLPWRGRTISVRFDIDQELWRGTERPGHFFHRVGKHWETSAPANGAAAASRTEAVTLAAIPRPHVDATPIPRVVHYGWVGADMPPAHLLDNIERNARMAGGASVAGGWHSIVHVDIDDPAKVETLTRRLAPSGIAVRNVKGTAAFNAFLATDAGAVYSSARNGIYPSYAAAMDVFRLGMIAFREGGLYIDMDDRLTRSLAGVDVAVSRHYLALNAPVDNLELGLERSMTNSQIGAHAGSVLVSALLDECVLRHALYPDFFDRPRPPRAADDLPATAQSNEHARRAYIRHIARTMGPTLLDDVLAIQAPEYRDTALAIHGYDESGVNYDAYETALETAASAFFPLDPYAAIGSENSWRDRRR